MTDATPAPWWRSAVIYQVYPRSFQDTDGDGVGDLKGVERRLDYLRWLGVDALWLSPIFPSPMADFGYDINDYCNVAPLFGTLADFDRLLAQAHARGLRVILDYVPNHTSDRHPWFEESRASRDNPRRDWYIWRDPAPGGGPPNNWMSNFGGSAWTFDEATGQYFYHAFLREQPDLNWRNPAVRAAMKDVLRFWFDRGVDGFRIDVLWHLVKDARFRDNPPNPAYGPGQPDINRFLQVHSVDQPEIHEVVGELRAVADEYSDRLLIGEIYLPLERLVAYYGPKLSGVHLPFNFQLLHATWRAAAIAALVRGYEAALPPGGWPNWVLGNHDQPRVAHRVGAAQARVAAMLLLTLRGAPTIYYGDEIGMPNVAIPPDRVQDPWERHEPGHGFGRDPCRTPMQWTSAPGAGFTEATPWLPLSDDHATRNVETMRADATSILLLHQRVIALRRSEPALSIGAYREGGVVGDVFWFERRLDDAVFVIALNFGRTEMRLPPETVADCNLLLSSRLDRRPEAMAQGLTLEGGEGVILRRRRGDV